MCKNSSSKHVIIYDDMCTICGSWVFFVKRWDGKKRFTYVAFGTDSATELLICRGIEPESRKTLIYVTDKNAFVKSDAIIRVLYGFGGIWSLCVVLLMLPRPFRDSCYDLISRHRYGLSGAVNACSVDFRRSKGKDKPTGSNNLLV